MDSVLRLLMVFLIAIFFGWVGSLLWNFVMPTFGAPKLSLVQFMALAFLLRILVPGITAERKGQ